MKSAMKLFSAAFIAIALAGCASAPDRGADNAELVRVATLNFVNTSGEESHDYLGTSLGDATVRSMQRIFVYHSIPAERTSGLYGRLKEVQGNLSPADLRSAALSMDADLLIHGDFKVSKGKKGDSIEIRMQAFRADRGEVIAALSRQTNVSNRIFDELDRMTADLVQRLVAYRQKQMADSGQRDTSASKGGKLELTRESINIAPFIPPIF